MRLYIYRATAFVRLCTPYSSVIFVQPQMYSTSEIAHKFATALVHRDATALVGRGATAITRPTVFEFKCAVECHLVSFFMFKFNMVHMKKYIVLQKLHIYLLILSPIFELFLFTDKNVSKRHFDLENAKNSGCYSAKNYRLSVRTAVIPVNHSMFNFK